MPKHDDKPGAVPRGSEFDAPNLRGSDDVAGNANHEQVSEPLIENDLDGNARVRASENDREWLLPCRELDTSRVTQKGVRPAHV